MKLKVIELFGGIGACSSALERIGIDVEIADYVEIDKYAVKSFNAMHGTNFEPQDITKWDKDIQDVDLIMHGSPCQDFSLAGFQAGGDEGSGTRSSLMYETLRIVEKLKPKYVCWENVKNLVSKKHFHNFQNYLDRMDELGYKSYWKVLNSKNYGIPQNRERVFTISIRKDIDKEFNFPEPIELKLRLKDMLEEDVDEKYFLSKKMVDYIKADNSKWNGSQSESLINRDVASTINTGEGSRRCDASNYLSNDLPDNYNLKQVGQIYGTEVEPNPQAGRVYDPEGISPTMDTCSGGNRMPKVIVSEKPWIPIKNATKKGYLEAYEGDGVDISGRMVYHRGTVQHGMTQTIDCSGGDQHGVVVACASRKRGDEHKLEISDREIANCITTISTDSMIAKDDERE